jgi:hypothetical protein
MHCRHSITPPRYQLGANGERTPMYNAGGDRNGSGSGRSGGLVIHRVTKEISSSDAFPTLTKTNYHDWAVLLRVMLQAWGMWLAVSVSTDDYTEDRMALEVLTKAVSQELMGTIVNKVLAKSTWDSFASVQHRRGSHPEGKSEHTPA